MGYCVFSVLCFSDYALSHISLVGFMALLVVVQLGFDRYQGNRNIP